MNAIEVFCKVREYPDNHGPYQTLTVRNHWNGPDRVILEINGQSYVFVVKHLMKAIENDRNAHT